MFLSLEPMGSVGPKITTGEDFKHIKGKSGHSLNMLCPAQAYPTPFLGIGLILRDLISPHIPTSLGSFHCECVSLYVDCNDKMSLLFRTYG